MPDCESTEVPATLTFVAASPQPAGRLTKLTAPQQSAMWRELSEKSLDLRLVD